MPPGGHESLDDRIAQELADRLGPQNYQRRLQGKAAFQIEGGTLVVHLANPLVMQWLQSRHALLMNEIAGEVVGPNAQVEFRTASMPVANTTSGADEATTTEAPAPRMGAVHQTTAPSPPAAHAGRRRFMDFTDFVVGESNQLAFTAARQVAEAPGVRLNPLVLHGAVGLGKSHLMEGVVQEVRTRFPAMQTLLVTAESFLNYFTEAMKSHSLPSFRQKFRRVDVLLIDDIEFLCGKRASREELLNTIKKLTDDGCQMVFASDRHPRLLEGMGDELISRLMAGMVCRIESPDVATRRALAAQSAARLNFALNDDILDYIADRFRTNAREILGAVNSLYTHALVARDRMNLRAARKVLGQFEGECQRVVRMSDIEDAVCGVFHVTPQALRSSERKQAVCHARHLAIYLSRRLMGAAFTEIGSHFGNRNHSTIITSNDKIKSMIANQRSIKFAGNTWLIEDLVDSLEQQILAS
jgi:chromosomal replication initiator protein